MLDRMLEFWNKVRFEKIISLYSAVNALSDLWPWRSKLWCKLKIHSTTAADKMDLINSIIKCSISPDFFEASEGVFRGRVRDLASLLWSRTWNTRGFGTGSGLTTVLVCTRSQSSGCHQSRSYAAVVVSDCCWASLVATSAPSLILECNYSLTFSRLILSATVNCSKKVKVLFWIQESCMMKTCCIRLVRSSCWCWYCCCWYWWYWEDCCWACWYWEPELYSLPTNSWRWKKS